MSGTPLNPARLVNLLATVAKSLPFDLLTDEVCKSWEDNGAELARRMAFLAEMAPSPKRKKKAKNERVNPAEFFVASDAFYVDPDFLTYIDLTPCADDLRALKLMFELPTNMNDSAIAVQAGGKDVLRAKRTTVPQLIRELKLALKGESRLFVKGNYYLLYIEGQGGGLYPVGVYWRGGRLDLYCYRFDGDGEWIQGRQVCGN